MCEMDLSHKRVMRDGGVLRIQPLQVRNGFRALCRCFLSWRWWFLSVVSGSRSSQAAARPLIWRWSSAHSRPRDNTETRSNVNENRQCGRSSGCTTPFFCLVDTLTPSPPPRHTYSPTPGLRQHPFASRPRGRHVETRCSNAHGRETITEPSCPSLSAMDGTRRCTWPIPSGGCTLSCKLTSGAETSHGGARRRTWRPHLPGSGMIAFASSRWRRSRRPVLSGKTARSSGCRWRRRGGGRGAVVTGCASRIFRGFVFNCPWSRARQIDTFDLLGFDGFHCAMSEGE